MNKCTKHDKVFSDNILMTLPPQREWICKICKTEGVDSVFSVQKSEYDELKEQKKSPEFLAE